MGNFSDVLARRRFLQSSQPFTDEQVKFPTYIGESQEPSALEQYKQAVLNAPKIPTEKPSMFRRIMGGLAGYGEGKNAPEARFIARYPKYADELREYNQRTGRLGEVAGIETQEMMNRYRMAAEQAKAGYYGRGNRAYVPTTEAEAIRLNQSKLAPQRPVAVPPQSTLVGPNGEPLFTNTNKPNTITKEDRIELENLRHRHALGRLDKAGQLRMKQIEKAAELRGGAELSPAGEKTLRDVEAANTIDELGAKGIAYDSAQKQFYAVDETGKFVPPNPAQQDLINRATLRHQQRLRARIAAGSAEPFEGNTRYNPIEIDEEGEEE